MVISYSNQNFRGVFKIKHWEELFDYYLKSQRFSDAEDYNDELFIPSENIFDIVFESWILWDILGDESPSHRNRLKELIDEAQDTFAPGPDDRSLVKNKNADELERAAMVFFLGRISGRIELLAGEKKLEYNFPLRPPFWLLSDTMKANYRQGCDISDSNTKMMELMDRYQVFEKCMDMTLQNYRYNRVLYFVAHDDSYVTIQWIIYMFVIVMNLMVYSGYKQIYDVDEDGVKQIVGHALQTAQYNLVLICTIMITILSSVG